MSPYIMGLDYCREPNEPWLGVLLATILASSESIGGIVTMRSLKSVAISAQDTSVMIAGAGKKFLIAAILKDRVDPQNVHNQMLAVGKTIGEVM
jgi:predicted regulator of Ras-like GTPase activity (Roadblock/LC7/MglB family)